MIEKLYEATASCCQAIADHTRKHSWYKSAFQVANACLYCQLAAHNASVQQQQQQRRGANNTRACCK